MTANADFNGNANANGSGSLPVVARAAPAVPPAPAAAGAAVYVDTENLQDAARAYDVVQQVIAGWPPQHPPLAWLSLYVRADKVELWRMWAKDEYPALRIRVRGVQHFSNHRAKNSADLAITADAVADLITGQAAMVAVISNDSDFGALFVKVRELAETAPFLWITAPDAGLLSPEIERFIPARHRWDLSDAGRGAPAAPLPPPSPASPPPVAMPVAAMPVATMPVATMPAAAPAPAPTPAVVRTPPASVPVSAPKPAPAAAAANANADDPGSAAVAEELIRRLPAGRFKVGDAQKVIRKRWPKLAEVGDTAKLGQYLLKEVWPELQRRGVTMPVTKSPRAYEITQAVKDAIIRPPAVKSETPVTAQPDAAVLPQSSPELLAAAALPQPSPELLAAAVAAGIAEDTFSASQAQGIIKTRFPGFAPADTTPQRFGAWFLENLWPVIRRHGVNIAREKPRRYEMTPDARQRLAELAPER